MSLVPLAAVFLYCWSLPLISTIGLYRCSLSSSLPLLVLWSLSSLVVDLCRWLLPVVSVVVIRVGLCRWSPPLVYLNQHSTMTAHGHATNA